MTASIIYVDNSSNQHTLSAIQYGSSKATKIYLGGTLVWSAPSTASWIACTSGNTYLAAFTPTVNMTVASFSMIHSVSTTHNGIAGIWTISGSTATPVTNACVQTGITVSTGSVLGANTQYTDTVTYTTKPSLVAGTTYYCYVGDRYVTQSTLSGNAVNPGYLKDWAFSATSSASYTSGTLGSFYLNVVSA